MDIIKENRRIKQTKIRKLYYQQYLGNVEDINDQDKVSLKKIRRIITDEHRSLKEPEYRNINQKPIDGYLYMRSIAHIIPIHLVDIDEFGSNLDDIGKGKGYAPVGEKYLATCSVLCLCRTLLYNSS